METTAGSGSGTAGPVEDDRLQEPDSSSSTTAAAPPPLRASATPLHLEQAGGGADGSSPATVVESLHGDGPPPSSTRTDDYAAAFGDGVADSSDAVGGSKARVRWSYPVVAETREVPNAAAHPLDPKQVARQRFIERLMKARAAVDKELVLDQTVIERLIQEQSADEEANRRWEQQFNSLRAQEAMYKKEQEKLSQAHVGVKVRPKQDKLPQVKGKSFWSLFKNKIFCRKGREIYSEHVKHQTHPITEVRRYHKLASDKANHLDAYSEFRRVIGDGECFYRSFIFSYLEQVIDRLDTDEEHRLLDVLETASARHADLGWNSEFPRSSRAFKELIEKVMKWKSTQSTSSHCKGKLLKNLLKFFSTYEKTKDIFVFLRLLVAIEICSHRVVYEPIIPEVVRGNCSLEVWCLEHVIPARVDADHVMMVALASALEVPLRVESFQRGYAPDIYTRPGVPRPSVTLLYTGHHYDIIYPRAPSAESSSHQASQREDPTDQSSSHQASQREDPADQS
ncbi:hypothetical protein ZWY2020_015927 [Hordeum vulgare]|nr:hypothetical protein ZWY2020_015927 [Hordeum vulgare]